MFVIHVAFAIHDGTGSYCKYLGVAIHSLLDNTKEKVTVHVLHDMTLRREDKNNLSLLADKHGQEIQFHSIDVNDIEKYKLSNARLTVGTFFRLKIPDVLPANIRKIVYLDADIIVHLDIADLWNVDLGGRAVAACADRGAENGEAILWLCEQKIIPASQYFNAGVLVMDLDVIRKKCRLFSEGMDFLVGHPECRLMDQDALNWVFKGDVQYIDEKFNSFSRYLRGKSLSLEERIYHISGESINMEQSEEFEKAFFRYLAATPWGTADVLIKYLSQSGERRFLQIIAYQCFLRKNLDPLVSQKIIFGAAGLLNPKFLQVIPLKVDYYLDNDTQIQGTVIDGVQVYPVEHIRTEAKGSFFIVVLSMKRYYEIKSQLEGFGLRENEDFFDGRALLTIEQGGYEDRY